MTNIVGQSRLLATIDSYYAKRSLPKTMLFIGPSGCGKHTLVNYVAEKFGLSLIEITEEASAEELDGYLYSTIDTMYLIDLNRFSEKQQNQFLKFIEEPSKSVYISLIANSESGILGTVLNRCVKHSFDDYTIDEVAQITNTTINEQAFKMFKTPGKLLNMTDSSFNEVSGLAKEVVQNVELMTYPQALAVSTKINYKDLYDKVDFNLFFDAVEYTALEAHKNTNNKSNFIIFNITNKFKQYATQQNLLKETLMLNYLTTLWEALQNDLS